MPAQAPKLAGGRRQFTVFSPMADRATFPPTGDLVELPVTSSPNASWQNQIEDSGERSRAVAQRPRVADNPTIVGGDLVGKYAPATFDALTAGVWGEDWTVADPATPVHLTKDDISIAGGKLTSATAGFFEPLRGELPGPVAIHRDSDGLRIFPLALSLNPAGDEITLATADAHGADLPDLAAGPTYQFFTTGGVVEGDKQCPIYLEDRQEQIAHYVGGAYLPTGLQYELTKGTQSEVTFNLRHLDRAQTSNVPIAPGTVLPPVLNDPYTGDAAHVTRFELGLEHAAAFAGGLPAWLDDLCWSSIRVAIERSILDPQASKEIDRAEIDDFGLTLTLRLLADAAGVGRRIHQEAQTKGDPGETSVYVVKERRTAADGSRHADVLWLPRLFYGSVVQADAGETPVGYELTGRPNPDNPFGFAAKAVRFRNLPF